MFNLKDRSLVTKIGVVIAAFSLLTIALVGLALVNMRGNTATVQGVLGDQQHALYYAMAASEKKMRIHQRAFELHTESEPAQWPVSQAAFEKDVADLRDVLATLKPLMDDSDNKFFLPIVDDLSIYVEMEKRGYAMRLANDAKGFEDLLQDTMSKPFDRMDKNFNLLVNKQHNEMNQAGQDIATMSSSTMSTMFGLGIVGLLVVAAGSVALVIVQIARPVGSLTSAMDRLSIGDIRVEVPSRGRRDEIGRMANALQTFKEAAIEKLGLEARSADLARQSAEARALSDAERAKVTQEQTQVVGSIARGLENLSSGTLTFRIAEVFAPDYDKLRVDFNGAMDKLQDTMSVVASNTAAIRSGTGEISSASDDLSRRTEQQAASLEETAAALDEITATVSKTAESSKYAHQVVSQAKQTAEHSGEIVRQAVQAMSGIEKSSGQIGNIIGVIDEIAFQTNLLALNAGVEAARAGDAGRGFAVVASEVRALAQRSAEAAKEIKTLISASSTQVEQGVDLVAQTGKALDKIVAQVAEINGIVSEIAASAHEQSSSLHQVNTAVNQMDQVTQQNAAMVEEATAASHALAKETEDLARVISSFDVGETTAMPPQRTRSPVPRVVAALRSVGRGGAVRKPSLAV